MKLYMIDSCDEIALGAISVRISRPGLNVGKIMVKHNLLTVQPSLNPNISQISYC